MINGKITKHGTGTTDQPCLYFIEEGYVISRSFGYPDTSIWGVQSAGISLRSGGQKESGAHSSSRILCSLYGKTEPKPYQRDKNCGLIYEIIDRHSSKNSAGGVFIKTRAWRKKKDKLNLPAPMTGSVSKNSHRFTVSLSLTLDVTIA